VCIAAVDAPPQPFLPSTPANFPESQGNYNATFVVGGDNVSGPQRRRLLQEEEGDKGSALIDITGELVITREWLGYTVAPSRQEGQAKLTRDNTGEVAQYLGAGRSGNRVLGGLLLNLRRSKLASPRDCRRTNDVYTTWLHTAITPLPDFTGLSWTCRNRLHSEPEEGEELKPYGADPVFSSQSELYNPRLLGREGDFYNVSSGSDEVDSNGFPHAWFHSSLPSHPEGFPLVLDAGVSKSRLDRLWRYVLDGRYADRRMEGVTAELATYNADLHLLGFLKVAFTLLPQGGFKHSMKYSVIPANNGSRLLASQLTLYAVGIAGLVFLALGLSRLPALHALLARQVRRIRRRRAAAMKPANSELHSNASSALDVAIGMLLLISAVYGGAALNLATTFSSRSSYQVYDSPTSMPARFFMLRRHEEVASVQDLSVEAPATAALTHSGRWGMQRDSSGLQDMASHFSDVDRLADMVQAAKALSGVAVILAITRVVVAWRWQPRVRIILGTLTRALPDLYYFSLTAAVVLLLMAGWGHLLMGSIYQPFATFGGTLNWVMLFFIAGDLSSASGAVAVTQAVRANAAQLLPVQLLLIRLWLISLAVFVYLMLVSFLFAILGVAFFVEKFLQDGGAPSIVSQIRTIMRTLLPHCGQVNPHRACRSVLRHAGPEGGAMLGLEMQRELTLRLGLTSTIIKPRLRVALADMRMTEEDLAQILLLRLPKGEKPGVARRLAAVSIERFGELPNGRVTNMMDAVKEQVDNSRRLGAVEVAQLLTCSRVKADVEALAGELELQLLALALAQQELDDFGGATGAVLRRWSTTGGAALKAAAGKVRVSGLLKRASNQQGAARLASIIGAAHASAANASPLAANKFKRSVSKRRGEAALQRPTAAWAAPEGTSKPASGAEGASSSDTTVQAVPPQPSPQK